MRRRAGNAHRQQRGLQGGRQIAGEVAVERLDLVDNGGSRDAGSRCIGRAGRARHKVSEKRLPQVTLDGLGGDNAGLFAQCAQAGTKGKEAKDKRHGRHQDARRFPAFYGAAEYVRERPCLPDEEQPAQERRPHRHGKRQSPPGMQRVERDSAVDLGPGSHERSLEQEF